MTDTKDDEAKQTAWEAGYEEGCIAATRIHLINKKRDEEIAYTQGYLAGIERGKREAENDKPNA